MIGVLALARRIDAGDVGGLLAVHPQSPHGVVHAGEDLHGHGARIVAHKLLVDLQNSLQLAVEDGAVNVGQVEVDHRLSVNPQPVLEDHLVDGPRGHVSRHQVAVLGIPLFQEVKALGLGDAFGITVVARLLGNPDASALAARRLRHQPQLVLAGNRSRMNLNKLSVGVITALLVKRALGRAGAHHRIGGLAENGADAAGADDDGVRREGAYFHGAQVQGADAAAHAVGVQHRREELPVLVLLHLAFRFEAPHLFIQRV